MVIYMLGHLELDPTAKKKYGIFYYLDQDLIHGEMRHIGLLEGDIMFIDNNFKIKDKIHDKSIIDLKNTSCSLQYYILKKACSFKSDEIDLIITPHNFFAFKIESNNDANICQNYKKIRQKINELENILNNILNKKKIPLIIGIDWIKKDRNGNECFDSYFNPYSGIDSIVGYFSVHNKTLKLSSCIWESWHKKNCCDQRGFYEQKENRVLTIKKDHQRKQICLLSCGDIFSYCHKKGKLLPHADIYINLVHFNLKLCHIFSKKDLQNLSHKQYNDCLKKLIKDKKIEPNLCRWLRQHTNHNPMLIVAQNFTRNHISSVFENIKNKIYYLLIWPYELEKINFFIYNTTINTIKKCNDIKKCDFMFIDIQIDN